jgi:hypothetical protein
MSDDHKCVGQYIGMNEQNKERMLLAYKCSKCGGCWNEEVGRLEALNRHPFLRGDQNDVIALLREAPKTLAEVREHLDKLKRGFVAKPALKTLCRDKLVVREAGEWPEDDKKVGDGDRFRIA